MLTRHVAGAPTHAGRGNGPGLSGPYLDGRGNQRHGKNTNTSEPPLRLGEPQAPP